MKELMAQTKRKILAEREKHKEKIRTVVTIPIDILVPENVSPDRKSIETFIEDFIDEMDAGAEHECELCGYRDMPYFKMATDPSNWKINYRKGGL